MDRYRRLHLLARAQHGVWTRAQARACGFGDSVIDLHVDRGAWNRWFDGPVYTAAGTPATWEVSLMAGALRVGEDAVVAGRCAARLWGLPGCDEVETVELVVKRGHTPAIAGIDVRRTIELEPTEVIRFGAFVTTSVTRTIHDLARVTDDAGLLLAAADGYRRGRTDPLRLLASVHARPRLPGNPRLRRVIEELDDRFRRARSVGEIVGITVLDALGYRGRYRVNVPLTLTAPRKVEVDVLFDDRGVLEILGAPYHGDVVRRRADAERRAALEADGYVVAELWARELSDHGRVRAVVAGLLARAEAAAARGPLATVSSRTTVSS